MRVDTSVGFMGMMMKTLKVQKLMIKAGYPVICVPLTPRDESELKQQMVVIHQLAMAIDLIEWRADYWKGDLIVGIAAVYEACRPLKKPLLFTIRTDEEGGEIVYSKEAYESAIRASLKSACFDLYDLQLELVKREFSSTKVLMDELHKQNKGIILSYHDFHSTPTDDQMLAILSEEESLGADLVKLAVMSQNEMDCERLMAVSRNFTKTHETLAITISMGEFGVKSRIFVKDTGSCISFASAFVGSAPGQISVTELRKQLLSN